MLGPMILAAQLAASPMATPRPAFTPAPLGLSAPAPANSLGAFAKSRKINKDVLGGTIAAGTPLPSPAVSDDVRRKAASDAYDELIASERHWRERTARLKAELLQAKEERDEIAAKIPTYVWTNRNGSQVALTAERDAAIAPYQVKIDRLQRELDGLPEECRKAGCQPGWIR